MSTATRVAIAAIVLLTAALGLWFVLESSGPLAPAELVGGGAETTGAPAPIGELQPTVDLERADEADTRAEVLAESEPQPAPPDAAPAVDKSVHIDGRFVDASGVGIARVRVVKPDAAEGRIVESDAQGQFAMTLAAGARLGMQTFEARATGWATHFSRVELKAGSTVHRGEIVLVPGGTIVGIVVDENERPVADARVLATKPALDDDVANLRRTGPGYQRFAPETKSGADGSFQLDGVPAELVRAWASSSGRRWGLSEPIDVPARDVVTGVVLQLVPLADDERIEGVVLDPRGGAVPGASVTYRYESAERSGTSSTKTDDVGRFSIVLARKVPHDLSAKAKNESWTDAVAPKVEPGTLDVVLQLQEARKLELVVRDEKGAPIEAYAHALGTPDGREQTSRGNQDESHPAGRAEIAMPSGPFLISVWARGRERVQLGPIDPATPPTPLECTLVSLPGLSGRVLQEGKPVAGAQLVLMELVGAEDRTEWNGFPSRLQSSAVDKETADSEGRYHVTVRRAGTFALLCDAPGYALAEVSPVEVDPRVGRGNLDVHVVAGGVIEGRVRAPAGRDVAGVVVGVNRFDCRPKTRRVGADGRYRFENLTPGGWSVTRVEKELDPSSTTISSYQGAGAAEFLTDCVVESGRVTNFDLDLRDAFDATLVGHVTVNGQPATGWTVTPTPKEGVSLGAPPTGVVDARGDVRIALPRPGAYGVELRPVSVNGTPLIISGEIAIHAGDNHWARDLQCGTLEGTATGVGDGLRLDCAMTEPGDWICHGWLRCEDNGRFRVTWMPVGKVRVTLRDTQAEGGWRTVAEKHVDIVRGETATLHLP